MDENVMSQLDAELEHAGEETALGRQALLKPLPPLISVPLWGDIDMRGRLPLGREK